MELATPPSLLIAHLGGAGKGAAFKWMSVRVFKWHHEDTMICDYIISSSITTIINIHVRKKSNKNDDVDEITNSSNNIGCQSHANSIFVKIKTVKLS